MTRRRTILLAPALAVAAAGLAIAGCGSSSSDNNVKASPAATTTAAANHTHSAVVGVRNSKLGRILVDAQGRTLYLFEKDKGAMSTCFGACASAWPPLTTTGNPKAGAGAM